jgi:SPP1 family phage portal protein
MFSKPIQYNAKDTEYVQKIKDVFFVNSNPLKAAKIGLDLIVHGVAYKLFYTKTVAGEELPAYSHCDVETIIPIYDYDIEPNLIAAIRYFIKGTGNNQKTMIEVYYATKIVKYELKGESKAVADLNRTDDGAHGFGAVPLVVYGGSGIGIFDPVKKLIDGVDTILSMDLNEIEKFALAYLVLTGQKLKEEDVERIKQMRIFELEPNSTLDYLTKQIDNAFNGSVLDFLVAEIHKQSGVPDFASKEFAALSGIALLYKLIGFENTANDIESDFIEGEKQSIQRINAILYQSEMVDGLWDPYSFWADNRDKTVDIVMSRNLPEDVMSKLNEALAMKTLGMSQERILEYVPTSVVDDVQQELEREKTQREEEYKMFAAAQFPLKEPQMPVDEGAAA